MPDDNGRQKSVGWQHGFPSRPCKTAQRLRDTGTHTSDGTHIQHKQHMYHTYLRKDMEECRLELRLSSPRHADGGVAVDADIVKPDAVPIEVGKVGVESATLGTTCPRHRAKQRRRGSSVPAMAAAGRVVPGGEAHHRVLSVEAPLQGHLQVVLQEDVHRVEQEARPWAVVISLHLYEVLVPRVCFAYLLAVGYIR